MDANNLFDALSYFKGMCKKNKLAKAHAFYPCVCSGINSLEEVLQNLRRESAFFAVDDTNDGVTIISAHAFLYFARSSAVDFGLFSFLPLITVIN